MHVILTILLGQVLTEEIWCECKTVHVNKKPLEQDYKCDSTSKNDYPRGSPESCILNCDTGRTAKESLDRNSTHCKSSQYCYRKVRYISTNPDDNHSTCGPNGCNVEMEQFGCVPDGMCFNRTHEGDFLHEHCCNETNCNSKESLGLPPNIQRDIEYNQKWSKIQYQIILVVMGIILVGIFCFFLLNRSTWLKVRTLFKNYSQRRPMNSTDAPGERLICQYTLPTDGRGDMIDVDGSIMEGDQDSFMDSESTMPLALMSGSGGGCPALGRQTVALQIKILEEKGRGRYGSVHRANWQGDEVAVKKFQSWDDDSWQHEVEIYETQLLSHENILRYIAADTIDNGHSTERWLITEFYERGSLYDYLNVKTVTVRETLKLMRTCIAGIQHLHNEIGAAQNKQPIAHRDIKSRNILVSNEGTAVIADLGLALRLDEFLGPKTNGLQARLKDSGPETEDRKIGTTRYMSPEVLTNTLDATKFESYKQSDIYSLALVLWEIISRTTNDINEFNPGSYMLPYAQQLRCRSIFGANPTVVQMKAEVVEDGFRPLFSGFGVEDKVLSKITKLIDECWTEVPSERLTALRLKKSLSQIMSDSWYS